MREVLSALRDRHGILLILLSFVIVGFGVCGYVFIEGFTFLEALYMTIITLTTVGFGEIRPLDASGRIFTIILIMAGVGFVAYNLTYFTRLLLDGNLLLTYRRLKVKKRLEQLDDHYIICGYGQMGQIITEELQRNRVPVVVVEKDELALDRLREREILLFEGDATEEESLIAAGVERARGLVSVVSKDTDNVFIVLSARDLNKELFISSRANTPGTDKKLLRAGANRVVSPYAIGAFQIAHNILRPTVTDFLELALSGEGMELSMEELCIPNGSELIGKKLRDSGIRSEYNLIVVAIRRRDGTMLYNPAPEVTFASEDILVAIGPQDNLNRFMGQLYEKASACSLRNFQKNILTKGN